MNNPNFSLPHLNAESKEQAEKAQKVLNDLARKWSGKIILLTALKILLFIATAVQFILIATFLSALATHKVNGPFFSQMILKIGTISLLKPLINYGLDRYTAQFSSNILLFIRKDLFNKMMYNRAGHENKEEIGASIAAFSEKSAALIPYFARYLPQLALATITPLLLIGYIFTLNYICALMMLVTLPVIPVYMMLIGKGTAATAKQHWQNLSVMGGYFYDRLKGMITLYVYGQLPNEIKKVEHASGLYAESALNVLKIAFLSSAVLEFFSTIIIAGIAIYIGLSLIGYLNFGHAAQLNFTSSLIILLLVPDFFTALKTLGTYYHDKAMAVGAVMNFQEAGIMLEEQSTLAINKASQTVNIVHPPLINFDRVSFGYANHPHLLNKISLHIQPGEKILLKGLNGSGKSTLLTLLMRFNVPQDGLLSLDGINIANIDGSQLYELMGWAGQHARIFNGTLRSNLLMGKVLSDAKIMAMITLYFDPDTFLKSFPGGLDTKIAEDGRSISGGERHKIALARVMIKKSPVLLLDEPFTHMDPPTVQKFMQSLLTASSNKTIILTAHGEHYTELEGFRTIYL